MSDRPVLTRLIAIALAATVALGAAACGDSDDGNSSGGNTSSQSATDNSDQREVRRVVDGLYEDLGNYDAEGVCSRMSPKAQRQIAQGAVGAKADKGGSCADAFGKFLDMAKKQGGLEKTLTAKVGKIEVDGDEALVTVSFGPQRGQIPLSKIDGEWKMGVSLATPSSAPPAKPSK